MLRARFAETTAGRGSLVLLVGEPGIGKTATVDEFLGWARRRSAEVLVGRCYEGDGAPAFWPWTQVIRAYVRGRDAARVRTELGPVAADVATVFAELDLGALGVHASTATDVAVARARAFDGIATAFRHSAEERPIVVCLDDLHGADRASLSLLQQFANVLPASRVMIVAAMRDVARDVETVDAVADGLVRTGIAERLPLLGLAAAEVGTLLRRLMGRRPAAAQVAEVHARTAGNPLYVAEIGRALASTDAAAGESDADDGQPAVLPTTVQLAIARRLAALSAPCRELLTIAAFCGRSVDLGLLTRTATSDVVPTLLEEARRARLIELPSPTQVHFAHALVTEVLQSAAGPRRAAMHGRVAAALAAEPDASEHATELAHHWYEAGPSAVPLEAVRWSMRAAERALMALAWEEALRLYGRAENALRWVTAPDVACEAKIALGIGEAHKRAGDLAAARRAFVRAAALARRLASPELLTRAALGFAPPLSYAAQAAPDAEVVALLEEAISAWEGGDSALHAQVLARLTGMMMFGGDVDRRAALFDRALGMARRVRDPSTLRDVIAIGLASYVHRYDVPLRLALAKTLVTLAKRTGGLEALAVARLWRAVHLIECGDGAAMRREVGAFERLSAELRQPVWSWYARLARTSRAILDGRLDDAARDAAQAHALARDVVPFAAAAHFAIQMLVIRTFAGAPEEWVGEFKRIFESNPIPAAVLPLAWIDVQVGRHDAARAIVARVTADDFAMIENDPVHVLALVFLAEICAAADDRGRAARLYDMLAPYRDLWAVWTEGIPLGPIAYHLGLLARTLGRVDDAVAHLERALAACTAARAPIFAARARHALAAVLRDRDPAHAAELLAETRAACARFGFVVELALRRDRSHMPEITADGAGIALDGDAPFLQRSDESWVIGYGGTRVRLRDTRGVRCLAELLRHPGRSLAAEDLAIRSGLEASRREPRGREGARLTVTKAMKHVLDKIASAHPELGRHFAATIRRGARCAYVPDPARAIVWRV